MEKVFKPNITEQKIYKMWENGGYFTPKVKNHKKPYSILLPLPNANDPLHMGHALFTVQDILIRYHRMLGDPTLWLPGGDHAGIETQFVFEKHLNKQGQSRFNYDRNTLYKMISEFVEKNKNINRNQMKRLGFSLDWSRYHYSLEPKIIEKVIDTFVKLHQDGLVYRDERLVNYCTKCGTAFSDLEVNYREKEGLLYYLDYGIIQIATARPETIFADTAVCVQSRDARYQKLIGKKATIPLINKKIPIIKDNSIKKDFGTGALKVTPAHDRVDYEIGKKHNLKMIKTISNSGRMVNVPDKYQGLKVVSARQMVAEDLKKAGKLIKNEKYNHKISVCYRCKTPIEPMLMPQWFIKTKPLAKKAISAVKTGKTKIKPLKRFEKMYFDWLDNITDWNVSRQIVWGPRLPIYYCLDCNPQIIISFLNSEKKVITDTYYNLNKKYTYQKIIQGLQSLTAPLGTKYQLLNNIPDTNKSCENCHSSHVVQETDTFDTWFLSGQWPATTLGHPNHPDFKYFYPTSVLDTMWDILFFWVARMMMLGIYVTGVVPFKTIHLHSRVVDKKGQKMSKSRGNVINPIDMADKYGADALRFALVFGAGPGSDISLSEEKIKGMRNFANKVWNIGRFLLFCLEQKNIPFYNQKMYSQLQKSDQIIISELNNLISKITNDINGFRFSDASQTLYDFIWHTVADKYIEENKQKFKMGDKTGLAVFRYVYINILKLLHPFMPFVTEEIWGKLPRKYNNPIIISSWPKT